MRAKASLDFLAGLHGVKSETIQGRLMRATQVLLRLLRVWIGARRCRA